MAGGRSDGCACRTQRRHVCQTCSTQLYAHNAERRSREICETLKFKKHYVLHSLRKYWASTVAQQGMDWKVMLKMFGHSDFELILSTYYAQNDDARMVPEASKIDFGLGLSRTA